MMACSGGYARWRVAVALGGMFAGLALAGTVFWWQDTRYALPTPRPANLVQPARGEPLPVAAWIAGSNVAKGGKPLLLHFFNPYCPCSRFNLEHVRELQQRFGDRMAFVGIIQATIEGADDRRDVEERLASLHFELPYVIDADGSIAASAGVYSTPQGVLVDERSSLVYRGNYNVSRYCTDERSQFVRIAIESMLAARDALPPDTPAYGCELPSARSPSLVARLWTNAR
jgi:hypothetical protein